MDELQSEFVKYQLILDNYYDRKERIYRRSREIAIESKRIIFLLHRPKQLDSGWIKEAESRLQRLRDTDILSLAKELKDEDYSMFQGSYCFGLQEYVEALLFFCFLTKRSIVTLEDVRQLLTYTDDKCGDCLFLQVTIDDYVAAVSDFGGELTRFILNAVASGSDADLDRLCHLMQRLFICLNVLPYKKHCFTSKLHQFRASVRKVEKARFLLYLRCAERKQFSFVNWLPSLGIRCHHFLPRDAEMPKEEDSE
ncbi:translin family protein [Trichuris suis]|nr:translin family protein [Trichuris suis]